MPDSDFSTLSTAAVSDALDRLGRPGALHGIAPLANGLRITGRAYTVRYVTTGSPPGTVGDYIDDIDAGEVAVLDNQGRTDCTVWGDILTAVAHHRGLAGTVIDGVCRDVHRALSLGYPIYSRGRFMRTGKDRVEVSGVGVPVSVGGVRILPGDLIIADSDGAVAVPRDIESQVLDIAAAISEVERKILADALSGASIADARARHGYHLLQRKEPQ